MAQPVGFLARVTCNQCGRNALTESGDNFGAAVFCGCCPEDHDHDAAANACPGAGGNHDGQECPAGDSCQVLTPAGEECPGGHCALGVDGCTVCRPVTIELLRLGAPVGVG